MGSGQYAVHSVQQTTVQRTVGIGQWAVGSGQLTGGSVQWPVDSGNRTVGSGQWTFKSGLADLYSVHLQNIRFISLQIFA